MGLTVSPIRLYQAKVPNRQRTPNFTGKTNFAKKVEPQKMLNLFAQYKPIERLFYRDFFQYKLPIHNNEIGDKIRASYTSAQFKELYDFAKSKGTFDYIMNQKTGFVKTSFIESEENQLMSDLIWITDTCNNMELVKHKEPYKCTTVFNKISEFYAAQQHKFDEAIYEPHKYNWNGLFWAGEQHTGVGHCYIPETKEAHPWYPKTRLESVGNYIKTATDLISTGLNGGKYGYKTAEEIPEHVMNAITNSTAYVKALHYPTARSCGAWEEQTFVYSLTSDTSIINQGLRELMKLMYKDTQNPEILKFRSGILNCKHGNIFNNRAELEALLKAGEQRIRENPNIETLPKINYEINPSDYKSLGRKYDSAMAFMPQTETLVEGDVVADSIKKLKILDELADNLVRENGAIRYQGDGYLRLNYHHDKELFSQDFEAEWFLVSEFSKAYGKVAENLLKHLQAPVAKLETWELMERAVAQQTEYINRSYARITPEGMIKSNGYPCPAFKVPEAYEAVIDGENKIRYVPGAHPLTWAESSLKSASDLFLSNLKLYENF